MSLTLSMYEDGIIYIGEDIRLHLHDLRKGYASVSITAPKDLRISRRNGKKEILREKNRDQYETNETITSSIF